MVPCPESLSKGQNDLDLHISTGVWLVLLAWEPALRSPSLNRGLFQLLVNIANGDNLQHFLVKQLGEESPSKWIGFSPDVQGDVRAFVFQSQEH